MGGRREMKEWSSCRAAHPLHVSKISSLSVWESLGFIWMWLAEELWWDLKYR